MLVVVFLAIGLHEYAHAKFADNAGDPTPRLFGRVTLNLTKHFEPLGTMMMIITSLTGFGIGWGKPVPVDPSKMKNPRWDHFMTVAAGPVSNLLQALVWALLLRGIMAVDPMMLVKSEFLTGLFHFGVIINLGLFFFNCIPLGPLDGMWLLSTFFNPKASLAYRRWNLQFGQFVLLGLVIFGQVVPQFSLLGRLIGPPLLALYEILTGLKA